MSRNVPVELKAGLGRHLKAGHPWVFRKAIEHLPKIPAGSVVDLIDQGRFAARGYFDPHSAIAVRVLTTQQDESIDAEFYLRKIKRCLDLRGSLFASKDTNAFRLIHGESDGLPGVVVDLYAGFAVLKLYSAGLKAHRDLIVEAVQQLVPNLKGIVGRDEVQRDDQEDDSVTPDGKTLWGEGAPETLEISERGVRFYVDVYRGQKTGFFLDQRENRSLVRSLSHGKSVLNCFAFSGGFSVNAALGGATRVVSVDQDAEAIALARQNFKLNNLDPTHAEFLASDVFQVIHTFEKRNESFDIVILDPPAFAKSQKAVEDAVNGYASLNRQALAVVKEGGLLITSSCTARVSEQQFFDAVKEAGFKADVELTLIEERYQPIDHPVRMQFKEGKYLKFYVLRCG